MVGKEENVTSLANSKHLTQTMSNFHYGVLTMRHVEEIRNKHYWNLMALLLLFTLFTKAENFLYLVNST